MTFQMIIQVALAACVLLHHVTPTSARTSFWEHVRNNNDRGWTLLKAQMDEAGRLSALGTTKFRYLNNNTQPYRVSSLPSVPFNLGEMYSGLIPIKPTDLSRQLFFVFQPTIGTPVDEITIWFNGGPGCSSLEGFLKENGRFTWQPGTFAPVENPYTWVNLTNMLWVEQPVGTGYSIGTPTAKNEVEVAADFLGFFKNFQDLFGIKHYKIYVTGESYAGRYVPYVSRAMLDKKDLTYYNLQGALMYDPCIGSFEYAQATIPTYPFVVANNNLLNYNQTFLSHLQNLHESCGFADYMNTYLTFPPPGHQPQTPAYGANPPEGVPPFNARCDIRDLVINSAFETNPCNSIYDISLGCPLLWDVLGLSGWLEYTAPGSRVYFDRADVKQAMHAPMNRTWLECTTVNVFTAGGGGGGPEYLGDLSPDPIQSVLPQVIEATNRVLVSNGDYDMLLPTNGTLMSIQNMSWGGLIGFQTRPSAPIVIDIPDLQYAQIFQANGYGGDDGPQGTMGMQHFERGLMWAETYQAGHQQPQYQPRVSYRHMQWLLGHVDKL